MAKLEFSGDYTGTRMLFIDNVRLSHTDVDVDFKAWCIMTGLLSEECERSSDGFWESASIKIGGRSAFASEGQSKWYDIRGERAFDSREQAIEALKSFQADTRVGQR